MAGVLGAQCSDASEIPWKMIAEIQVGSRHSRRKASALLCASQQ
ncbi:MAG: hypothetical protein ACI8R4_002909 [Paracoccaceae bacterium]|jgi:hypothetical protein